MRHLSILIGDDHVIVRQAIKRILEDQEDWRVVAEAADGREAVRMARECHPDIAILDVAMPAMTGIDAAAEIRRSAPATQVLMLSMHSEQHCVSQALRAGARGYLLKDSGDTDLIKAVTAVAAGASFFSPVAASVVREEYLRQLAARKDTDHFESLSEREREVLQLVAEGHTNRVIAEQLSIRPATVETHRSRILQKLGVHNTAQLIRLAFRRRLIA